MSRGCSQRSATHTVEAPFVVMLRKMRTSKHRACAMSVAYFSRTTLYCVHNRRHGCLKWRHAQATAFWPDNENRKTNAERQSSQSSMLLRIYSRSVASSNAPSDFGRESTTNFHWNEYSSVGAEECVRFWRSRQSWQYWFRTKNWDIYSIPAKRRRVDLLSSWLQCRQRTIT